MLLTVKLVTLAIICGVLAVAMILVWMWSSDPEPLRRVEIGHGIKLPTYVSGPLSHSWWAMVVLLLVAGSLYLAYVFSYLYLWTVSPQVWPKPDQAATRSRDRDRRRRRRDRASRRPAAARPSPTTNARAGPST